jgi:hypothetical protein
VYGYDKNPKGTIYFECLPNEIQKIFPKVISSNYFFIFYKGKNFPFKCLNCATKDEPAIDLQELMENPNSFLSKLKIEDSSFSESEEEKEVEEEEEEEEVEKRVEEKKNHNVTKQKVTKSGQRKQNVGKKDIVARLDAFEVCYLMLFCVISQLIFAEYMFGYGFKINNHRRKNEATTSTIYYYRAWNNTNYYLF